MTRFEITMQDRTVEVITGAQAYVQEGPMTTFFETADDRAVVDSWSTRVASFRTADIFMIRRSDSRELVSVSNPDRGSLVEAVGA